MRFKINIYLVLLLFLSLSKISLSMIGAGAGGLNHPGLHSLDLKDVHLAEVNQRFVLNNCGGSDAQAQDNFRADWHTITLLNEAASHQISLGNYSSLDRIADNLLAPKDNVTISCDSSYQDNQATSNLSQVNDNPVSNVTLELKDLCDSITTPLDKPLETHQPADLGRFSSERAFENRHAEDTYEASKEHNLDNEYQDSLSCENSAIANRSAIKEFELLINSSYDPKALLVQINASLGKSSFFRKMRDTQTEYRNFLWDSNGKFMPINSSQRQEQAFIILYDSLKNHFGHANKAGLIKFLEKHVEMKTPGAQRLLEIETGKGRFVDRMASLGNNISSSIASLNFLKNTPNTQQIEEGKFLRNLSKLVALCKAEKFKEAKLFIESIRKNISSTSADERIATIEEYNCLCGLYDSIYKSKCTTLGINLGYINDPFYKRSEGSLIRGAMKPDEANRILEARDFAFKSIAYKMGYDPRKLTEHDKNLIYKEIDKKTKDSIGLHEMFDRKDILNTEELNTLQRKCECYTYVPQQNNLNDPGVAIEETEPIEPTRTDIEQEVSITESPPPLEPKEPREKTEKVDSQNQDIKKEGIKQTSIYKNALETIRRNTHRFTKLGLELLSKDKLKHIINNHYKIGEVSKQRASNSIFNENIDLVDLILTALELGAETEPGVKTYDCGKIIGHSSNGNPTSIIKVCLDKTKTIIKTSFPG